MSSFSQDKNPKKLPGVVKDPGQANFCAPENEAFYAAKVYEPLDKAKKDIRLVKILPGNNNDEIQCELVQSIWSAETGYRQWPKLPGRDADTNADSTFLASCFLMEGAPVDKKERKIRKLPEDLWPSDDGTLRDFALSYSAGDPSDTQEIRVNKRKFNVFRCLNDALRRLRRREQSVLMWIDQICIDQSNTEERGHQVAMMADIYRHAILVQVWLGSDPQ